MMIATLVLMTQAIGWSVRPAEPTIGDTIWVDRFVRVDAGAHPRLLPLDPTAAIEPLLDPTVARRGDTLTIRYALTVFEPGQIAVTLPALEIQYAEGRAETLPAETISVTVASVLPTRDPLPAPQPSLGPLARRRTTPVPLIVLVTVTLASLTVWGVRRRWVRPRPAWAVEGRDAVTMPVERWADAGESRAVAAATADALRQNLVDLLPDAGRHLSIEECERVLASERPDWPRREIAEILRALERARFAPAVPDEILALARRAEAIAAKLT